MFYLIHIDIPSLIPVAKTSTNIVKNNAVVVATGNGGGVGGGGGGCNDETNKSIVQKNKIQNSNSTTRSSLINRKCESSLVKQTNNELG